MKLDQAHIICHLKLSNMDLHAIASIIQNGEYEERDGTSYVVRWKGKKLSISAEGMQIHIREIITGAKLGDIMPRCIGAR